MTTADIQQLREQTGVGMMDAKRALEASHGDMAAAVDYLRQAGQKIAASKSTRQVKEGAIGVWISDDKKSATLVALACETDFVARTEEFQAIAATLARHLGSVKQSDVTTEQFLQKPGFDGGATVQASLESVVAKLGENMQLTSIATLSASTGTIDSYLHASRKVAALVAMDGGAPVVSHDVAMHIAALNPAYLSPESVPADIVAHEQEIYREQLSREGKPQEMWEKILPGKVKKFYADVCLLEQPFVKDDSLTISTYLKQSGSAVITGFRRVAI